MIFFKELAPVRAPDTISNTRQRPALVRACLMSIASIIVCLFVAALFYGPFWWGHALKEIMYSFSSQPSVNFSVHSPLYAIQVWESRIHPLPHKLTFLGERAFWSVTMVVLMGLALVASLMRLWRAPTVRNVAFGSLTILIAYLFTTNWLLPWYVTVIVSLAAVTLPLAHSRVERAICALTLTFSGSIFLSYFYTYVGWYLFYTVQRHNARLVLSYVGVFTMPLLAFLIFLLWKFPQWRNVVEYKGVKAVSLANREK